MDKIFSASSIIVFGVSERGDNLARNIISNLIEFDYRGQLYLVGRRPGMLYGRPIVTLLDNVPDGIDLAVILVPAPAVPDLIEQCGRKGIQRVVIESGGFAEFGAEGQALQTRMMQIARKWRIRIVGPNGLSVINLAQGICLPFVPFVRENARPGHVGVIAQSGGVSLGYIDYIHAAGLGISKVVSMGNKLDLNEVDYLAYLLADAQTHVICMYLESFADGRALFDLARAASKPILLHKANLSDASARIARSHTAALADDDKIVSAAAAQAGIIRCADFRQTVECAKAFNLPPVRGRDLIVFARSGGHAVIAADAAARFGFRLAPFEAGFLERARQAFRADVLDPTNPLDMGLIFDFDVCAQLIEGALQTTPADAILYIHGRTSPLEDAGSVQLLKTIQVLSAQSGRPIAACVYGNAQAVREYQNQVTFPLFSDINDALLALAASRDFHARQNERVTSTNSLELRVSCDDEGDNSGGHNDAKLDQVLVGKMGELRADEALQLSAACGLPVAAWAAVADVAQAKVVTSRLGYPLAIKVISPDISHKSDVGGVAIDIANEPSLAHAVKDMQQRLSGLARIEGFLLQKMAVGHQVILGARRDPSFGPVLMFGLGGIWAELFADVSFRLAPITRREAQAMIDETRAAKLLRGLRGQPPANVEAVVKGLLCLSRLMCDRPQIVEIDINPLIVSAQSALVVDARVVLAEEP